MRHYVLVILGLLLGNTLHAAEKETPPQFEWVIQAGGKLHDKTRGIAVDGKGNVYLTGEFTGTATFGEFTLTSNKLMDFFIAKVDPKGKFLWVRSGGGSKIDRGYAITVDDAGNSYVTGHYESTDAKFEEVSLPNSGITISLSQSITPRERCFGLKPLEAKATITAMASQLIPSETYL